MRPRNLKLVRGTIHLLALIPLLRLLHTAFFGDLGPDPAHYVVRQLGFWGIVLLWTSLAMTPLKTLTGQPYWIGYRRALGLWSFAYICLHLTAFLLFWCGLSVDVITDEIGKRPYILVGLGAWLLMVPLALTSTRNARRRLGRRWNRLHKLVYLIAMLALLHLIWIAKLDYSQSIIFSIILIFLFFIRIRARQSRSTSIECASSA